VARQQAEQFRTNREYLLEAPLARVLNDSPFVDRESLLAGLVDFHRERMARVPSATKYPEMKPWVEHVVAVDREFRRLAGLTDSEMALHRSLGHYLTFRGFVNARPSAGGAGAAGGSGRVPAAPPVQVERCRIVYLPDSDHGQMHIKNVDDPCTHWKELQPPPKEMPWGNPNVVQDGVGSGLHIDDEPEEIFPIDARSMMPHHADDVPGAVEFLTRYKPFWGGGNLVIRDRQKRSAAFEKCSYNFIEVFHPGPNGASHCSGMACRDPHSPQGKYQRAKRQQYLTLFGQPADGPDQAFWDACDRAERKLADGVQKLGRPAKSDQLIKLFTTPWPEGLNKAGAKLHPMMTVAEYTLLIHCGFLDEKRYLRWQRDPVTLEMQKQPDVYQF
jgi:hypothetical protein